MRRRGLVAAAAVIASLSLAVSACSSPSNNDDNTDNKSAPTSLSLGWNQPFYSYNDATSNGNATANANIKYMMLGGFWYYTADAVLKHDESFGHYEKVSDDPLTVKYTMNDDTVWSDGTAVDATDLLLYWAALSGNRNTISGDKVKYLDSGGVKVPKGNVYFDSSSQGLALVKDAPEISDDNKSVTLVYTKPFADWELDMGANVPAHVVAMHALGITDPQEAKDALITAIQDNDKDALEKIANFWNSGFDYTSLPDDPSLYLSNGSYIMTDFKENEFLTLEKNEKYAGDFPGQIDTLTVRWNEDPLAQVQALQNGEIDFFSPQVTTDVINAAEKVPNVEIDTGVEGTYEHFDLVQNNGGPFDPKTYGGDEAKALLVRQAFLHGIPRQEVVTKLVQPITPDAEVRNSFLRTAGTAGYDEIAAANGSADYAEVDPALSKQLLQQAGVTTPVDVRVMYAKDNVRRENEFEIYKPALAAAGFNLINARNIDWGSKLGDGTYDAVYFGWQSTSTGVTADSGIFQTGQINNLVGYSNKTVDGLFDDLAVTTDADEQLRIQIEIEKILWADAVGITIFQFPGAAIWNSTRVEGVEPAVLAPTMFYGYWNWTVPGS